jgi:type IV pilus assembly protein PilA
VSKNRPGGFTLIELLIVLVVIGILAAIAIPKFSSMRKKSYIAAVTSDLKSTASLQEVYVSDNNAYAATTTALEQTLSDAVSVTVTESDGRGWAATATHSGLSGESCGIFYGNASASNGPPATQPGTVSCN